MKKHSLRIMLWVMAMGALALAAKVITDYNHSTDFAQYKSYSWVEVKADPLWVDRVQQAIDREFMSKGWTKVPAGGDVSVAAFGSTQTVPRIETFYNGLGGGWYWRGFGDGIATTTVDQLPVGTLVVDLFDTPTKKLIWRGVARDSVSDKPEKNEKKLDKAVAEMFKHFPPPSKG